jgi:23S rRNA-/tRNA-specific pseudouridylate synthase
MEKVYLAKVHGKFHQPNEEAVIVKNWIYMEDYKKMYHDCTSDLVKLGEEQRKTAKDSETAFELIRYDVDSDTSIVKYIF